MGASDQAPAGMPAHLRKRLGLKEPVDLKHMHQKSYAMKTAQNVARQALNMVADNILALVAMTMAAHAMLKLETMYSTSALEQLLARCAAVNVSVNLVAVLAALAVMSVMWLRSMLVSRPVYLVDFEVHRPATSWQIPRTKALTQAKKNFTEDQVEFQYKVLLHSGLGNETSLPPWLTDCEPQTTIKRSREEFEMVCITCVQDLLSKCGVSPKQIGLVIVNCSLFSPTPSLAATIMHRLHMRPTTLGYNLGGMGCSAGVIAIDLARELLQNHAETYALVVSTEVVTQNVYKGKSKSMLIPNTIFRVGGSAMLLSNRRRDSRCAKYRLQHLVRTINASERGFSCVMEQEDEENFRGVKLSRELMQIAGETLKMNLTRLGPKVLPLSELLVAGANMAAMKLWGPKQVKPYVPDFSRAFKHVCIHTGGRGVIDAIEGQMGFSKAMVEPSRASLFRFGNVSSASIWYVLAYIESFKGLAAGDRVWQMGFGSGFKANSAVWVANRRVSDMHGAWKGFSLAEMRAELSEMEAELWRVVEAALDRKEAEEAAAAVAPTAGATAAATADAAAGATAAAAATADAAGGDADAAAPEAVAKAAAGAGDGALSSQEGAAAAVEDDSHAEEQKHGSGAVHATAAAGAKRGKSEGVANSRSKRVVGKRGVA